MKDKMFSLLAKVCSFSPVRNTIVRYAKRRPYTHIGDYMERYWIIHEGSRLSSILGHSVRLHVIKQPDNDRAMHTHPFSFRTMVIDGGYMEIRQRHIEGYIRHTGDSYELDKNIPHMIYNLLDGKPATTIFITGKREDDWYFDTDQGLIPHKQYLEG